MNDTLLSDILKTASNGLMIMIEMYFISEIFKYDAGYTEVVTTEYKLFKCRESGNDTDFMMFADSEEELQIYFDVTHPNKKFLIEEAEMNAKSIKMKVINGDVEYEDDEDSSVHS
jgi:alkyl hydroperoxide reductase subunit AhpC